MPAYYTDAVAAAACGTRARQAWAHHTHTVDAATGEAICGKVKADSLLGDECATDPAGRPTCPTCAKRDPRFK